MIQLHLVYLEQLQLYRAETVASCLMVVGRYFDDILSGEFLRSLDRYYHTVPVQDYSL